MWTQGLRSWKKMRTSTTNLKTFVSSCAPEEKADCVVIGAGVVGLAIARELSRRKREVLVLESSSTFGSATSSRNSEVIHSGIYYPPNSNKAVFCVRGREMVYRFCGERGIPFKQIGKLIVATRESEVPKLYDLLHRGRLNGVIGLTMMDGSDAARTEPELSCVKALYSPVAGIVDSHSLMLAFLGEAENQGTTFAYNTTVIGGDVKDGKVSIHVVESKSLQNRSCISELQPEVTLTPNIVINSAGLSSTALARRLSGLPPSSIPPAYFARGCYFTLSNTKSPPFQHLVYPLPEDGGAGIHVTVGLDGQVKFGPNVEWIDGVSETASFLQRFEYDVDAGMADEFYEKVRKYYPNLRSGALEAGYAGVRPKIGGGDFVIQVLFFV